MLLIEVEDMSRLIDADLLMRKCEKWLKPKAPDEDEMVSVADIAVSMLMEIEEQPTAFDVEKVIEQLNELLKEKTSDSGEDWYTAECLAKAIEIVKQSGVNDFSY